MNRVQKLGLVMAVCGAVSVISACAGEFAPSPRGSEPEGAVEAPGETNSASGEMASLAAPGTALVTVTPGTGKNDRPTVTTVIDGILKPPATGLPTSVSGTPTTLPTPVIKSRQQPDAISGPSQ